jgi:hypothetical protein
MTAPTDRQCAKLGCREPGSQPSCQLCPCSRTRTRKGDGVTERQRAEAGRIENREPDVQMLGR